MVGRTVVGWENPILGWCALRYPARGLSYAKRLGFTGGSLCSHPQLGGANGWYFAGVLWWMRGFLDLLVGGVGMRRGRRNAQTLAVGDALDFWRVEAFEPDRRLSLVAEMKVPGRAWLQFEVEPIGAHPNSQGSTIRQTAIFDPAGLGGLVYWYALYPVR